jgi:hypothetical protein
LNHLYLHPKIGDLLDSGEIDFVLLNIFEELANSSGNALSANSYYARNELIISPLFEALFDCNILWKSKYYDYFCIENKLSAQVIIDWCKNKKAAMNAYDKLMYKLYKKSKGIKLGT